MKIHPGTTMTITDIPVILKTALPLATTPVNIMKGFEVSGICPFNRDIFTDLDFSPSYVTDRPPPSSSADPGEVGAPLGACTSDVDIPAVEQHDQLSTSSSSTFHTAGAEVLRTPGPSRPDTSQSPTPLTPEDILPLPKAGERKKTSRTGRKKRNSSILTDTPIKETLRAEQSPNPEKPVKRARQCQRKLEVSARNASSKEKTKKKKPVKKPKKVDSSSSEEEETFCFVCTEPFSNSRSKEVWIQCTECRMWAHQLCTSVEKNTFYVCDNCESDTESVRDDA